MRLIFASPTYGPVDPLVAQSHRAAIMHASNHGHIWAGDISPNRLGFEDARNRVVAEALRYGAGDVDAVMWLDSDIMLPLTAITQLADHGLDFVTGVYCQRMPPHAPVIAVHNGKNFSWMFPKLNSPVLAPIDGCGFGVVLTSTRLLAAIPSDPAHPWFEWTEFSEDFTFCLKAKAAGFQLHVDTAVMCGHMPDPSPITFSDMVRLHPEVYGAQEKA